MFYWWFPMQVNFSQCADLEVKWEPWTSVCETHKNKQLGCTQRWGNDGNFARGLMTSGLTIEANDEPQAKCIIPKGCCFHS